VARVPNEAKLATLLIDLLTVDEEVVDMRTAQFRFDIELPAERLVDATNWVAQFPDTMHLQIGYFGASTGAAAALVAAAVRPDAVGAAVSRGGRPDLAGAALPRVRAPTLLIVGGNDGQVIELNRTGARADALRKATGDRAGSNAPIRRTWRAGRSGAVGARLVSPPSQRINVLGGAACPSTKPVRLVLATECRLTFVKADEEEVDTIVTSTSCTACD
jgi:hypothetical protein